MSAWQGQWRLHPCRGTQIRLIVRHHRVRASVWKTTPTAIQRSRKPGLDGVVPLPQPPSYWGGAAVSAWQGQWRLHPCRGTQIRLIVRHHRVRASVWKTTPTAIQRSRKPGLDGVVPLPQPPSYWGGAAVSAWQGQWHLHQWRGAKIRLMARHHRGGSSAGKTTPTAMP